MLKNSKIIFLSMTIGLSLLIASCSSDEDPHTHSYGAWSVTKEATCSEAGIKTAACSCGNKKTETIPPTGKHTAEAYTIISAATCISEGERSGNCTVCTQSFTEAIPATGNHNLLYPTYGQNPTCTEYGNKSYGFCSDCSSYRDFDGALVDPNDSSTYIIPALGHSVDEWTAPKAAGCTTNGTLGYYTCSTCDKCIDEDKSTVITDILTLAKGHSYDQGVCTACGNSKNATEGLSYQLSDDETYYILLGMGNADVTELIIPATYEGLPVKEIAASAFYHNTKLLAITIPEHITKIGTDAFSSCTALTYIEFRAANMSNLSDSAAGNVFAYIGTESGGVTVMIGNTVKAIPNNLFNPYSKVSIIGRSTANVKSLIFEEGSILETIGDSAFEDCGYIKKITLPDSLKKIGFKTFLNCIGLEEIGFGAGLQTLSSYCFKGCESLVFVTLPSGVTSIPLLAFSECTALESINLGGSVKDIGLSAFAECERLYNIEGLDSLEAIDNYAFKNCRRLSSIDLPDGLLKIGNEAFHYSGLASVSIPKSVTFIGKKAFWDCWYLKTVTFENTEGWFKASSETATSGTSITITTPEATASRLSGSEGNNYWIKASEG